MRLQRVRFDSFGPFLLDLCRKPEISEKNAPKNVFWGKDRNVAVCRIERGSQAQQKTDDIKKEIPRVLYKLPETALSFSLEGRERAFVLCFWRDKPCQTR